MSKCTMLMMGTFLLTACVTHIKPDRAQNPAPSEPLMDFQHFVLEPVQATEEASRETKALASIDANLREKLGATISAWDSRSQGGRSLRIQPRVSQLKFVGVAGRFWAGPLAGSSAVLMKLRLVDVQTGRVIAEPEFYQRAAAMGGTFSVGGSDHGMLVRIATVAQQYLQRNYRNAVGGPTGLDGSEE
jgi:hypothetical protein